ncbi:alpha/beta hydrolase [Companilactobacillus allii]|nr:alpha/beta hydrolase [Companilactobacillus allii]USQ68360.1 alpha/beta hydrolase [Companilactobacillus allii]
MICIKKTGKILGMAGVGFMALKGFQAHKEHRSLSSLMIEETLDTLNLFPTIHSQEDLEQYVSHGCKPFELPEIAKLRYHFKYLKGFDDTLEYVPKEQTNKVIFYIHGGAYWFEPITLHYDMLHKLSKKSLARVVMPIYPKAPLHNAHEATAMVLSRYLHLINDEFVDPANIILMGDSAGAGMALSLLEVMRDREYPLPGRAVLLSPWLDVSTSNPEMEGIQSSDPLLSIKDLQFQGKVYADTLDTKDPLVSPIYGDLTNLPPIDVFTGTHDILYADAEKLGKMAEDKDIDLKIHTYENMNHVFMVYPIPEARGVVKEIAGLIS